MTLSFTNQKWCEITPFLAMNPTASAEEAGGYGFITATSSLTTNTTTITTLSL